VRPGGDHDIEMKSPRFLNDDVIETIVRGDEVHPAHRPLAAFAEHLRGLGEGPVPQASPELAALLYGREAVGDGTTLAVEPGLAGRRRHRLGPLAKVGIGTTLALAGATVAGAAGILPAAANRAVQGMIEVVSPVEFGGHHADDDNFGSRVSTDATGESDGEPGVDGQQISEQAPGAAHRTGRTGSGSSGSSDATGLDQANQTPAAPHAPDEPVGSGTGEDVDTHPGQGNGLDGTPGDPDGDGLPGVTPIPGDQHGPPDTIDPDSRIENP
jgi:hypothetical protein